MITSTMFKYEFGLWERILQHISEENILLKYKISELVNELEGNQNQLLLIERFQNLFILCDSTISLFRKDFYKHVDEINYQIEKDSIDDNAIHAHKKLRIEIQQIETNYNLTKFQFCDILSK